MSDTSSTSEEKSQGLANGELDEEHYRLRRDLICDTVKLEYSELLVTMAGQVGGFLENSLRKEVWPLILKSDLRTLPVPTNEELKNHPEYSQVLLDVERSGGLFPKSLPREDWPAQEAKLENVVMRVLHANPELHYYQGFHDISLTVLLVVDNDIDLAVGIMDVLARTRLRIFMEKNFKNTQDLFYLIYPIIHSQNPALRDFLDKSDCNTMFCISWYLTWFAHDVEDKEKVARLFDLFIAHNDETLPVYVIASITLSRSDDIMKLPCELPAVQPFLKKLLNEMDRDGPALERVIIRAMRIYKNYPRSRLLELEAKKIKKDKSRERWKKSYVGRAASRLSGVNWRIFGAMMVMSVAVGYQVFYRRSLLPF